MLAKVALKLVLAGHAPLQPRGLVCCANVRRANRTAGSKGGAITDRTRKHLGCSPCVGRAVFFLLPLATTGRFSFVRGILGAEQPRRVCYRSGLLEGQHRPIGEGFCFGRQLALPVPQRLLVEGGRWLGSGGWGARYPDGRISDGDFAGRQCGRNAQRARCDVSDVHSPVEVGLVQLTQVAPHGVNLHLGKT